eukprot:360598-Chlamydomonas_euryale.AAC.4
MNVLLSLLFSSVHPKIGAAQPPVFERSPQNRCCSACCFERLANNACGLLWATLTHMPAAARCVAVAAPPQPPPALSLSLSPRTKRLRPHLCTLPSRARVHAQAPELGRRSVSVRLCRCTRRHLALVPG